MKKRKSRENHGFLKEYLFMIPGALLDLVGAVELFQEHDPGQVVGSIGYAPCGAG